MTSMNDEAKTLRTDTRGRVRTPVGRREELLDEFERSGISAMRFAKLAGVNYATFSNWRHKRRKARAQGAEAALAARADGACTGGGHSVRLFEAFVEPGSSGSEGGGLVIELAGGARMTVDSAAQLRWAAELLGMLGQTGRRAC